MGPFLFSVRRTTAGVCVAREGTATNRHGHRKRQPETETLRTTLWNAKDFGGRMANCQENNVERWLPCVLQGRFTIAPPFITNATSCKALTSASGSRVTATR